MAKTCALCIITGFKDLETDARKKSAVRACAWRANDCKWSQGRRGREAISYPSRRWRKLHCFGIDGEIFLLNNFLTPKENNLPLTKRSFDQRVTRILEVSFTYVSY